MKVTIEFDMPDDAEAMKLATEGSEMSSEIWNFYQHLRTTVKHNPKGLCEDKLLGYETVYDEFCERFEKWIF